MKNRYKEVKTEEKVKPKKEKKSASKVTKSIMDVLNGNVLTRDYVISNLPFIGFMTVLMLAYIGLGYYAERNAKRIEQIENDLVEKNSEFISVKTELNMVSNPAQVADSTRSMGLVESRDFPPRIIKVKAKQLKEVY
jgi:hypothetical protein